MDASGKDAGGGKGRSGDGADGGIHAPPSAVSVQSQFKWFAGRHAHGTAAQVHCGARAARYDVRGPRACDGLLLVILRSEQ